MKFGMNLLLWTDDPTQEHMLPVIWQLKELGFDGVELPVFNADPARYAALGRRLRDMGLECTASTARMAEDNPISPDPAVRARSVELNIRAVECAAAAGATLLIGPCHAALGHFTGAAPTADEWRWGVESLRPVAERAGALGVTVGIEFLNRFENYLLNDAATTAAFVREVGHPACRMMYDTFHAHIEEKDIGAALRSCADVLCHVHISENDRSTPGQGQVDWARTFAALADIGYDRWLTIEAFGLSLPKLAAATRIWRRMFADEMQVARDGLAFTRERWTAVQRARS